MIMKNETKKPLRAGVVGVRGMGRSQARLLAKNPLFDLVGVCDLNEETVRSVAAEVGVTAYTDLLDMIRTENLDTLSVCTDNSSHAKLTILAAEAGVKGVYCEKPMASNLADARAMHEACESRGVALVVNHQRRVGNDLLKMRELVEAGEIGELVELRGWCAGDILSDGTHIADSLLWIAGDAEPVSVAGMLVRDAENLKRSAKGLYPAGMRYGHPVENGGLGIVELEGGVRLQLVCGELSPADRVYQDYEVIGTEGILRRIGDRHSPNLFLNKSGGGDLRARWNSDTREMEIQGAGSAATNGWEAVPLEADQRKSMEIGYALFHRWVTSGEVSPMNSRVGLRSFEMIMGIYESARLHRRLPFPITQQRFPLEVMLEEQQAAAVA